MVILLLCQKRQESRFEKSNNFLLTVGECRTAEYWLEVVAVRKQPWGNIPHYYMTVSHKGWKLPNSQI